VQRIYKRTERRGKGESGGRCVDLKLLVGEDLLSSLPPGHSILLSLPEVGSRLLDGLGDLGDRAERK